MELMVGAGANFGGWNASIGCKKSIGFWLIAAGDTAGMLCDPKRCNMRWKKSG
jgi:hypothetical protein